MRNTGIIGNQYLGQMIPIEYIDGLETATLTEILIPGEDEEDTEVLRIATLLLLKKRLSVETGRIISIKPTPFPELAAQR